MAGFSRRQRRRLRIAQICVVLHEGSTHPPTHPKPSPVWGLAGAFQPYLCTGRTPRPGKCTATHCNSVNFDCGVSIPFIPPTHPPTHCPHTNIHISECPPPNMWNMCMINNPALKSTSKNYIHVHFSQTRNVPKNFAYICMWKLLKLLCVCVNVEALYLEPPLKLQ